MATPQERQRNNVRAGIFVLAATILALAVVGIMRGTFGDWFSARARYVVSFSVESGVQTLTEGSPVRIGGLVMGEVTSVRMLGMLEDVELTEAQRERIGEPFKTIVVFFELSRAVTLYHNARAFVKSGLLGSEAWIEIVDIGGPAPGTARTPSPEEEAPPPPPQEMALAIVPNSVRDPDNWLRGTAGAGMLSGVLGPENAGRTSNILANIEQFTSTLPDFSSDYEEHIRPLLADASEGAERFNALMSAINSDWPHWAYLVEQTLLNALAMSDKLELAVDDGRALLADARGGVGDVREMIETNRPNVDAITENIRSASADVQVVAERISGSLLDKAEMLFDRGQDAVDSLARTAGRIEVEFDALSPGLRDAMANLQISSAELKLAMSEIRSSPWRLLYRPPADELEYENLYFAASKFALAATELKMASQAVDRAIANHRAYLDENPAKLQELQDLLAGSMTSYENAQRRLIELLNAQ